MSKKSLFIGAIASIIAINSVFADTTVTTKDYVDNQDDVVFSELNEIKQDIIPVAGTNRNTPGSAVVTYTGIAGAIGERFICDADAEENGDCDGDNLVTRDLLNNATNLPETTVTYKTCYQEVNGDCILWNLSDKNVYGHECETSSDCPCNGGGYYGCNNGRCDIDGGCMVF